MILSHKYRFIFVHSRKTAGSAITSYLNRYIGPRDVQTGVWYDAIINGGRMNRRFIYDVSRGVVKHPRYLAHIVMGLARSVYDKGYLIRSLNGAQKAAFEFSNPTHPTAEEIKEFDSEAWEVYYKFCFVRNPYERVVSDYVFRVYSRGINVSFKDFLLRIADPGVPDPERVVPNNPSNWVMYTIDNKIVMDFIGKYERLEEDFEIICNHIGIPYSKGNIPMVKKFKDYDYVDFYDSESRHMVERIFGREIDAFEYKF